MFGEASTAERFRLPELVFERDKWDVQFHFTEHSTTLEVKGKDSQYQYARVTMHVYSDKTKDTIYDDNGDAQPQWIIRVDAQLELLQHRDGHMVIEIAEGSKPDDSRLLRPIRDRFVDIEECIIPVSKELLGIHSPIYFGNLFFSKHFKEASQKVIRIQNEDADEFRIMNDWLEQWRFKPSTVNNAFSMLDKAIFYDIQSMREKSRVCLLNADYSQEDDDVISGVLLIADKFSDHELLEHISKQENMLRITERLLDTLSGRSIFKLAMNSFSRNTSMELSQSQIYLDFDFGRVIIELDFEECPELSKFFMKIMRRETLGDGTVALDLKYCWRFFFYDHLMSCNHLFDFSATDKKKKRDDRSNYGLAWGKIDNGKTYFYISSDAPMYSYGVPISMKYDCYFGRVVQGDHILDKEFNKNFTMTGYGIVG